MARSRGVTIYATYAVVAGTLGLALNATAPWLMRRMGHPEAIRPGFIGVELILSVGLLASGFGAVALKAWGRWLALGVAVWQVGLALSGMSALGAAALPVRIGFWTAMALRAAIVWFLTRPSVAAQFRRAA